MRRKPRPSRHDVRQPWQIAQAARCGCRGSDDLCACQNAEEPWKYGLGGVRPPSREERLEAILRRAHGALRDYITAAGEIDLDDAELLAAISDELSDGEGQGSPSSTTDGDAAPGMNQP